MTDPRRPDRPPGRTPARLGAIDAHVGERLRRRREELALSRAALARALGVSIQQMRRYETGRAELFAARLLGLARLLGVSPDHFFRGFGRPEADAPPAAPRDGLAADAELRRFVAAFWAIGDENSRRALLNLVETIATSHMSHGTTPNRDD